MNRSPLLDRYEPLLGEDVLSHVYQAAEPLAGLHVLHLNTTACGGGVAELLGVLIPLMEELGMKHTRKVIELDDASNLFTARLVDLLQGIEHGDLPEEDQCVFLEKLRRTPEMRFAAGNEADIYFVHDFQLAPLAHIFPWMRPALWMCHVDTAEPDPHAQAYIEQFLDAYQVCAFNTRHLFSKTCHLTRPRSLRQRSTPSAKKIDSSHPVKG